MKYGIIEIDRGKPAAARPAPVVVEVAPGGPESGEPRFAVRFLGFESRALVRGIDPARASPRAQTRDELRPMVRLSC